MDTHAPTESFLPRHGWAVLTVVSALAAVSFVFFAVHCPLPRVSIDEVASPHRASYVMKPGATYLTIAGEAYGSQRMSRMMLLFNNFAAGSPIPEGAVFETPSVPRMFQRAGLDERYQPMVNVLAKVMQDYEDFVPLYRKEIQDAPRDLSGHLQLKTKTAIKLAFFSRDVETACRHLQKRASSPHRAPRAALDSFREIAGQMRQMATEGGVSFSEAESLGEEFSTGFYHLLAWTKTGYR